MSKHNLQKLELTWIGKGNEPKLEPRILIEDQAKVLVTQRQKTCLLMAIIYLH